MEKKQVEVFDLSSIGDKDAYEHILNTYVVIKEEFAYLRDGTAKVTVWYVKDEDT